MFEWFGGKENGGFTWESIGDIGEGRSNLGESMPVQVYRLFQYTLRDELKTRFGNETAIEVFRGAGELAGREFAAHMLDLSLPLYPFMAHLQTVLEENLIGILRVEKFDPETGDAVLTVAEDLDCSGLPITGETVCNYDEGFLTGILKAYTHKNYTVTEVDCWATGSLVCRFEAKVKNIKENCDE